MSTSIAPLKVNWGDWVLGDLSLVMARVGQALGESTIPVRVVVDFPVSWAVPTVEVHVADADHVTTALERARESWEPLEVLEVNDGESWYARLGDLELIVTLPPLDGVGSC